jgi:hypothetical protein
MDVILSESRRAGTSRRTCGCFCSSKGRRISNLPGAPRLDFETWDRNDPQLSAFPPAARRARPRSATLRSAPSVAAIFAKPTWLAGEARLAAECRFRFAAAKSRLSLCLCDSLDRNARLSFAAFLLRSGAKFWPLAAGLERCAWRAAKTCSAAILSALTPWSWTRLRPIPTRLERCAWCAAKRLHAAFASRS